MKWIKTTDQLPTEGEKVFTKIDDEKGKRNEQGLIRQGDLWFHYDMRMYVYYTPTHWAEIGNQDG